MKIYGCAAMSSKECPKEIPAPCCRMYDHTNRTCDDWQVPLGCWTILGLAHDSPRIPEVCPHLLMSYRPEVASVKDP